MKIFFFYGCVAVSLLMTGCRTSDSSMEIPEQVVPESWITPTSEKEQLAAEELAVWWTQFNDQRLNRLVQFSLDENLDLQNAAARVSEAFALRAVAAGERVPAVNGTGGIFETEQSALAGGASFTSYSLGFDASWELDLWGRIRKTVDAADATARASIEDLRGIRALIASQVVTSYISVRELQLRQELAIENIDRQRNTLKVTQGRFDNGLAPKLDVNQAQVNLSSTEAALPVLRQQEFQALRSLEVLAGLTPGELNELLEEDATVPVVTQDQLTDFPANVLRRRPDIRAAEQRLFAAAYRVGVAEADLYPRVSLSGSFAWESTGAGDLFEGSSVSSNLGPSIFIPLFQGGRLRAQMDVREAQALQSELAYRQLILEALQEVENSLTSYQQEKERQAILQEGVAASEGAVLQVRSLYENGLVTFLNVLDAERNLAAQQDAAASSLGQRSRNLVDVYRAFGGGWDAPQFAEPEKEVVEIRTELSKNQAEVFLQETTEEGFVFKVDTYNEFSRLSDQSVSMRMEITILPETIMDVELKEFLEDIKLGERVLLEWIEEEVDTEGVPRTEVVLEEAKRISPPSP